MEEQVMRKIMLIGLTVFLISSCAKWEVLGPTDGELTVELLNVEVTFDYDNSELILFNKNYRGARVIVSRRANDVWSEYLELIDRNVPGLSEVTEESYFDSGDKIKLWIRILDDNNEEVWRETYFVLG